MSQLTESLNFLSWSTEAVNAVRGQLVELNVPLPAVLAQLLALGVFVGLSILFLKRARAVKSNLPRLINHIVAGAAAVAGLAIVVAWADNLLVPRSEQILGHIDAEGAIRFDVDLLDYRGDSLAPRLNKDKTGAFVLTYAPEFADPPSVIVASAPGCEKRSIPLRRAHLLGARLSITLTCGESNG